MEAIKASVELGYRKASTAKIAFISGYVEGALRDERARSMAVLEQMIDIGDADLFPELKMYRARSQCSH